LPKAGRRGIVPFSLKTCLKERVVLCAVLAGIMGMGFVAGMAGGGALPEQTRRELMVYINDLFSSLAGAGMLPAKNIGHILGENVLKTGGLLWLLGLSVIGAPLIAAILFLRGFSLGFTAGVLMSQLAWKGTVLAMLALLPHNLLHLPGLMLTAAGAVAFSFRALQSMLGRPSPGGIRHHFLTEGSLAVVGSILLAAGSLIEAYITPVLVLYAGRGLL